MVVIKILWFARPFCDFSIVFDVGCLEHCMYWEFQSVSSFKLKKNRESISAHDKHSAWSIKNLVWAAFTIPSNSHYQTLLEHHIQYSITNFYYSVYTPLCCKSTTYTTKPSLWKEKEPNDQKVYWPWYSKQNLITFLNSCSVFGPYNLFPQFLFMKFLS